MFHKLGTSRRQLCNATTLARRLEGVVYGGWRKKGRECGTTLT
jgi:hypothetical protein